MNPSFLELFNRHVCSNTPALVCGETVITYAGLHRRASALAAKLRSRGVGIEPTTPDGYDIFNPKAAMHSPWVVIISERSVGAVIGVIATLMAGGAFVLMSAGAPDEYIKNVLDDTASSMILCEEDYGEADGSFVYSFPQENDIACAIFTSGSTGRPKGAVLEHRVISEMLAWQKEYMDHNGWTATAMYAPFGFIASIWELFFPLANGLTLHILKEQIRHDLFALGDYIESNNISYMFLPPNVAETFTRTYKGSALKYLRVAGGKLHSYSDPKNRYEILYSLGMSENGGSVTFNGIREAKDGEISIGKPWNKTRVYLVDDSGEMAVSGPSLFRGYLAQRNETEKRLMKNPYSNEPSYELMYLSGDLAEKNEDGELFHRGRNDWIIKVRDMKVNPIQVENEICRCVGVTECHVGIRNNFLVAWFTGETDSETLKKEMFSRLPEYMVPTVFEKLDKMPRNINGKVAGDALPYAGETGLKDSAMNDTEAKFAGLFETVLGLPSGSVGVDSGFFKLGGDSLKLMRLQAETERVFRVGIPYVVLFDKSTPREMAELLPSYGRIADIPPAPRSERYPLSAPMRQMWLLWRTGQDRGRYTVSNKCRVAAQPDMQRLLHAFEELVHRNAILRSHFVEQNGDVFQVIGDTVPVTFTDTPRKEFDLGCAPLFDITYAERILSFTTHHIIADATGLRNLMEDLWTLYGGGEPPISAQVHDTAVWEQSGNKVIDREFWVQMLGRNSKPPELPRDFPRPARLSISAVESIGFNESETAQLTTYAAEHNTTLFQLFLTAYTLLLSALSRGDTAIGVPFAGRNHPDTFRTIGMFVRTLPIKTGLSELSFDDAVKAVKEQFAEVWERQDISVEDLMKIVPVAREASCNPFYDTMINYIPLPRPLPNVCGLQPEIVRGEYPGALFDLVLDLREEANGVSAVFTYAAELFKQETVRLWAEEFKAVLLERRKPQLMGNAEVHTIKDESQITDFGTITSEYQSLVHVWNDIFEHGDAASDDDFFSMGGTSLTAIRMEAELFEAGWLLSAVDIFQNPRFGDMAALMTAADDIDWEDE